LAILKAGAAYLPLDTGFPADRIAYMLQDSGARVLLTESAAVGGLPMAAGVRVIDLDRDAAAIDARSPTAPEVTIDPDSLAYVIYTSGSTGRPKGVMVRHEGVAAFLGAMERAPGLGADDSILAITTPSFDISVLEILLPLSVGGRVVLGSRETAADPLRLAALLESSRATAMQATPATWRMLLDSGWSAPAGLTLMSGGEPLPRDMADALVAGGARLWNLYGPTETTVWASAIEVGPGAGAVPIGGPARGVTFFVLSPEGEPVPLGAYGELFIGGGGVARGYLRRPALTAEKFVPDPFARSPGARMYATGDRARWRPDGTLEMGGRLDTQVKLRGFRIELGEIESVLREHAAVSEAVAAVREDVAGDRRLVAYVVAPGHEAPPVAELRALLRAALPEYMVPSAFVVLPQFPLTPTGKVDRRALPVPDAASGEPAHEPPATPTETAVAGIWGDILRVERVGARDNFFELGGHSLLATQVVARIRTVLGVTLPVRVLFEARTVRELAARVDEETARGPSKQRSIGAVSRDRYRIPAPTA
ncbi:MAG TPA: non-ribosomal peptide synthetase, partial [Longimicrobium sp.]|nr:non-ribosomal peptide synthetase [Longimicrobium sp.]